jgi:hypothetical protein
LGLIGKKDRKRRKAKGQRRKERDQGLGIRGQAIVLLVLVVVLEPQNVPARHRLDDVPKSRRQLIDDEEKDENEGE